MRTLKKALFLCLLAAGSMLNASIHPQPGQFGIQGEYLYWHPLYDQSYFVGSNSSASDIIGSRVDNDFNWQSGYRLEGVYDFCNGCNDVRLKWTWLDTSHSKTVTGTSLNATPVTIGAGSGAFNAFTGSANSKNHVKYYAVDLLFGQSIYTCCNGCPFDLWLQGGLQYANIEFKENITYTETAGPLPGAVATLQNKDCFWGVGPELGLDGRYSLSSILSCWRDLPLSLTGSFRTALLISESKATVVQTDTSTTPSLLYDVTNDKKWRIVPFWDLRFGLAYDWCCSCFSTNIEVGYEVVSYQNAIQATEIISVLNSFDEYSNMSFHGPYVLLGFTF